MTRSTKWRPKPRLVERPTLGQVQAAIEWQAPPRTELDAEDRAKLDQFAPSKPTDYGTDPDIARRNGWVWDGRQWVAPATRDKPAPRETVPTEQAEHAALAKWIRLQWWAKGARRLESQASRGVREQAQLAAEGGEFLAGNPDWMVFVPARRRQYPAQAEMTLAFELKRRDAGKTRPTDREWWLADRWPWQERGEVENPDGKHYGLSWAQACALRSMHAAGVRTFVAYGWDDAAEWLERQIGPRPAVEPDWGW